MDGHFSFNCPPSQKAIEQRATEKYESDVKMKTMDNQLYLKNYSYSLYMKLHILISAIQYLSSIKYQGYYHHETTRKIFK